MFFHLEPHEALEFLEYADRIARPDSTSLLPIMETFCPSIRPSVMLA